MTPGNTFREGFLFGERIGFDKISFRIHPTMVNAGMAKQFTEKGPVTMTSPHNDWWDVGVHAEFLNQWQPMLPQIASALAGLALLGAFRQDVALGLIQVLDPCWDWSDPGFVVAYVEGLKHYGFIEAEKEIAADFPCMKRPIRRRVLEDGHKFKKSLLSNDGITYYRTVTKGNTSRVEPKSSRKDTVIEYDRRKKTGGTEPMWRFEMRLQRHHLDRMSTYDLVLDFHCWFFLRMPMLVKFLRLAVKPGTWGIRGSELLWDHLGLVRLLTKAGWFFY